MWMVGRWAPPYVWQYKGVNTLHRAALTTSDLPQFFHRLDNSGLEEQTRLALALMLLGLARAVETCAAKWSELECLSGPKPLWRVRRKPR